MLWSKAAGAGGTLGGGGTADLSAFSYSATATGTTGITIGSENASVGDLCVIFCVVADNGSIADSGWTPILDDVNSTGASDQSTFIGYRFLDSTDLSTNFVGYDSANQAIALVVYSVAGVFSSVSIEQFDYNVGVAVLPSLTLTTAGTGDAVFLWAKSARLPYLGESAATINGLTPSDTVLADYNGASVDLGIRASMEVGGGTASTADDGFGQIFACFVLDLS